MSKEPYYETDVRVTLETWDTTIQFTHSEDGNNVTPSHVLLGEAIAEALGGINTHILQLDFETLARAVSAVMDGEPSDIDNDTEELPDFIRHIRNMFHMSASLLGRYAEEDHTSDFARRILSPEAEQRAHRAQLFASTELQRIARSERDQRASLAEDSARLLQAHGVVAEDPPPSREEAERRLKQSPQEDDTGDTPGEESGHDHLVTVSEQQDGAEIRIPASVLLTSLVPEMIAALRKQLDLHRGTIREFHEKYGEHAIEESYRELENLVQRIDEFLSPPDDSREQS